MVWPEARIVDLGGITAARGTEMYLPLWLALHSKLGTGDFNIAIERAGCRRTSGGARLCLWQDHAPS